MIMKKIKTINKLLNSLTLLSPLAGVGFNNQYQNTQKIITENNSSLNNYFSTNDKPVQMGDIWVTVEDSYSGLRIITGYSSGSGRLQILDDVKDISGNSFEDNNNIRLLDLSNATSLTTIGNSAFEGCLYLSGDLVIPSSVTSIGGRAFLFCYKADNLIFKSETPPTFGKSWQPTLKGKVYVPSKQAKQAFLDAANFGFTEDQVEIGLPKNSNVGLVLGLLFGLGIPIILAVGFGVWYLTKKKKNNSKN